MDRQIQTYTLRPRSKSLHSETFSAALFRIRNTYLAVLITFSVTRILCPKYILLSGCNIFASNHLSTVIYKYLKETFEFEFHSFIANIHIVCTGQPVLSCPDRYVCVAPSDILPLWASTQPRFSHQEHIDTCRVQKEKHIGDVKWLKCCRSKYCK